MLTKNIFIKAKTAKSLDGRRRLFLKVPTKMMAGWRDLKMILRELIALRSF